MATSIPVMGAPIARPLSGGSRRDVDSTLPSSFYRNIVWRYWLAALVVGALAWLVLFQLFHGLAGHP